MYIRPGLVELVHMVEEVVGGNFDRSHLLIN